MSLVQRYLNAAQDFIRRSRDDNLRWRRARQQDEAALRQAQTLAEQALAAELRKQAQLLEHELAVLKTRNHNELEMVKIQCQQDLQDYKQYLQSLDTLKSSLRQSYAHLPEAVAFTLHHHAKQLLNRMWESQQAEEKMKTELQLLQFMAAVHEDSVTGLQHGGMPEKALGLIADVKEMN